MKNVYQVSELVADVNRSLAEYGDVTVEGEVTNFTRSAPGHLYFTLKDAKAQLGIIMFASTARLLRFQIVNGLKLRVSGALNIYAASSKFQLVAVNAEPAGIGVLQLAFEQLKAKLAAEGLFDAARKKLIPMLPQRIAIVTSPTGAAIRDILNVLGRRFEGLSIQVYPVRVQGPTAAAEIAKAIRDLSRWQIHDVVLICRGGGSMEDLWSFNEEIVARAIADCPIPTISGVGHEIDFTISDFVADLRAATPSAAAEIVIGKKTEICDRIDHATRRISHVIETSVNRYRHELRHLASSDGIGRLPARVRRTRVQLQNRRVLLYRLLEGQAKSMRRRLASADEPLARFPARVAIRDRRRFLLLVETRATHAMRTQLISLRNQLRATMTTLHAVSPLSVLSRGYAIAFARQNGRRRPLLDSAAVSIGDPIEVQLKKGRLNCTIDERTFGMESLWPVQVTYPDQAPEGAPNSEGDDGPTTRK